jgi:hypothetical protein
MDYVKAILTNGAVWAAFIALVNGLIAWLVPDFPPNILALANALAVVVLGAVGIRSTRARVRVMRATRDKPMGVAKQ